LKAKFEELETNSKTKNIRDFYRGVNDFKKGHQPRTNILKDEKGDLFADSHSILARLFSLHGVNDVRQMEIHTTEPLVPEPSAFEIELVIEKLKSHKSPGIDQIPVDIIQAWVEQFAKRSTNLLLLFGIRRNCLRSGKSRSLYLSIRRAIEQTVVIIGAYHCCQLHTKFYPTSCCQG